MEPVFETDIFAQWFFENWIAAGGLITKKTAAELLGVPPPRITGYIKSGRLRMHKYGNFEFMELAQVKQWQHEKLCKKLLKEYETIVAEMPEEAQKEFMDTQKEILEYQNNILKPNNPKVQPQKEEKAACNSASITKGGRRGRPPRRKERRRT